MNFYLYFSPGTDPLDTFFVSDSPDLSGRDSQGDSFARLSGFGALSAPNADAAHDAALEWLSDA